MKENMRKISAVALSAAMIFTAFTGCGEKKAAPVMKEETDTTQNDDKDEKNGLEKAEEMAAQAKAAAEREEAIMSHEPIRFTGATDVAAQTHGKKKAGRLPSRGRRA